jgi:acyl CoA:acetate/3-ketoacid CoA transferase beta subunit
MTEARYNPSELLICLAARLMEDNSTAFIGTGIPMLAAALAQRMQAPGLIMVFEFGGVGAILEKLPLNVADSRTFHRGLVACGICDIMETAQRGFVEYGFLGGAQIDRFGNLNSTVIGPQEKPKVRLPGSGGANDVSSGCWRTVAIMRHDKARFVPKVDFITTPGYLTGGDSRERAGLPRDSGPYRVITNLGLLGYHPETREMMLLGLNPGVTVEQVVENTGFPIRIADEIEAIPAPTDEELALLREIDKDRLYI